MDGGPRGVEVAADRARGGWPDLEKRASLSRPEMVDRKRKVSTPPAPAKISVPRLSEVYERTALFRALDAARKKGVVWIAAPAGAGKTSLVTTYLAARRLPTLWYNVDARDADVANLFHYLTIAAKTGSRRKKLRLPTFAMEHQASASAFARHFFEELYRQRPPESVLVLDDYQDARSEHFDEVVREGAGTLPEGMSAIIISRAEPPPFLQSIAWGDGTVLGTDDLRLSSSDTAGLVRVYRPDLRGTKLKNALPRIAELTNGWAAALTLLLQNQRIAGLDPLGVEEFSERLFDYFATEILDKAAPSEREFLLKTAVVPSLSIAVATELAGSAETEGVLAELEKRSFLTQRLGTSGSYRYHPLLRGFLLRRAKTDLGRDVVRELHRRAAETLIRMDQIDEAMEQLEAAEDVALRTRLVLDVAPVYVAKGHGRTIETWIGRLPGDWVEKNGWLLYWQGVSCMGYAHSRPRDLLERAYAHFEREKDIQGLYLACATGLRAVVHEGRDFSGLDPWMARFEALEKSGSPCPPPFEPMLATGMFMASIMRVMDRSHHHAWRQRADVSLAEAGDASLRIFTGGFLAIYVAMFSDLYEAEKIVETLWASLRATESSALTELTVLQADTLCLWARGDNGACLAKVREALALAARSGVFAWNDFLNGVGSAAALSQGDLVAAREFLAPMAEAAEKRGGWPAGFYHLHVGWEALARGQPALALHHAEEGRRSAETVGPPFGRMVAPFEVAQALFAAGRRSEALVALDTATQLSEKLHNALVLHACKLVEADCFWDEDRPRALNALREGLALAREHGYHNMYWVSQQQMARLAVRALEHDIEPAHVHATIARRQLVPESRPVHLEAWPWRYHVRALGVFEVRRHVEPNKGAEGGTSFHADLLLPKGKPRELLQALVAFGGRGVRESVLVDALWPDAEGDTGRRVFDTTLHRLRRQLGDDGAIRLSDGCVYLDERLCWVDVWALEDVVARTEKESSQGASASALADLARQLIAIHRGPLLAEVKADWIAPPRDRLLSQFQRAAERLGGALESAAAFTEARTLYQRALRATPSSDALRSGLKRCSEAVRRGDGPASERHPS